MLGSIVDNKYRIVRLLGAGAMGSVYEGEHTSTGRRVAVKVISTGDLTRDEMLLGRFQREARAAGAIDTQHITQVLDAGVDRQSNLPFLVMEYLNGEDLSAMLKRLGPVQPDLALRIVAQACLGLQKAHDAGVVHRDIKPANLYLAKRDAGEVLVKLLDFGIAKVKMDHAQDAETASLTRTGSMLGSPLYMSPEQARGNNKDIDSRADLWSLGVVLYQALAGRTPWDDITALGQLIIAICQDTPTPVQEFAPWVSPEVAAIVHKAMKQDVRQRFQSAREMFDAMRPLLPYGWSISEDMFVSVNATTRAHVAPRFVMSMASGSFPPAAAPGTTQYLAGRTTTNGALSHSRASSPGSRSSSKTAMGIGAALVALTGIGGTYLFMARARRAAEHAAAATPPPVVEAAPPPVAPPPPPEVPTATPATETKRVKLVIVPSDATVDVEGTRVVAKGGIIDITGVQGSVHRVTLTKGKSTVETDVIVTELGAIPPKVELVLGPSKPAAAPTATAAVVAPPASPPALPGISKQFE